MGKCFICSKIDPYVSSELGLCSNCIRERPQEVLKISERVHQISRRKYGLPDAPPRTEGGVVCNGCPNRCKMGEGERGYCGLRKNSGGNILPDPRLGKLSFYHDPLPTNCVADWVCPGGTGRGYPVYAYKKGPETGYKNLAIFFHTCSFNCLFCQNWSFKEDMRYGKPFSPEELLYLVDESTSCVCFFGGDPGSQMPFAIEFSKLAIKHRRGRLLRICFETNGFMEEELLDSAFELSIESGGCVKFDLKAWNEDLHRALTGQSNRVTLRNFARLTKKIELRPEPPPLVASTLLVAGYVDEREVEGIARFIADLNPDIPYALLAFYPHFYMADLPLTKRDTALRCQEVALKAGLKNVRIGNVHLLR
ncbi:MAG: radical SAM protein [Syntrophobacterales bacterium]|nr:radical SAM protein [Syntrophobacterales bacterium]